MSDDRRRELAKRKAEHDERQRQDLIRQINGLRHEDFPGGDPNFGSVSEDVIRWQEEHGFRPKHDGEGLSPVQKSALYRISEPSLHRPQYGPDAYQNDQGVWVERGLFGCEVPAKSVIPDLDDFAASEREDRQYRRAAQTFWAKYKTFYPQDDAQAVHAALQQVQGALSTREMIDIAGDENSAFVAAGRIHQLIEAQQSQAQAVQDDPDDDGRAEFGNTVSYSGTSHGQQSQERSANNYTPMQRDMIELQKKMGIRKW